MQFDSKDEVIQWMIRAQIGRRNLSKAQRCALVRRFRPIYEKEAKENQIKAGGDKKSEEYKRTVTAKLPQANDASKGRNPTTDQKLAELANVSERTFRMCDKVLNSDNEGLKEDMLSDKKTINASYKELQRLEKEGHKMDVPQQVKESASNKVVESKNKEEHISVEEYLLRIKASGDKLLTDVSDGVNWLLQKEYISASGSDITSRIRTELNDYLDGLRKFQELITTMCPDECGNENVIQIKSM